MTVEPQHLPGAGTEREVLRFLDVPGMVAVPPPPVEWLARPLIARGSLTVLYAPGGDGKSLLAGALAGAIAEGTEVAGIECQKGTAIYLDAENGEHEIHRRVHTLGLPGEGVAVADASSFDLRRDLDVLAGVLRERQPDLAVLDSFRSLTPGLDENDTKQTAAAIDPLRRLAHETGVAVLLIHHSNKAGRDFRGASSIRDACDVLWHLGRADDDDDQRRRFLACRKMRIAAEPERMWLSLEVDRGRVLIDQAEPADAGEAKTVQPVRAVLSDRILAEMDGNVMKLAEVAEMVGRKPKDGSVRNALAALVAEGLLVRDTTGYSKVQTVQTEAFAPLHPAPEAVQSAKALKGDCTLHQDSATAELIRLAGKFPFTEDT